MTVFLAPADTAGHLKKHTNLPDNFYLIYNRFIQLKDSESCKFDEQCKKQLLDKAKGFRLGTIVNNFRNKSDFAFFRFSGNCDYSCQFQAKTAGRMIVGLGAADVKETALTLHYIYGFPYIPGSSLKGITRSYVVDFVFNGEEKNAEEDTEFINIFGNQNQSGKIIFFDAYPAGYITLTPDILNPHFSKYYSSEKSIVPPSDCLTPVPVSFLTVENTKFVFSISAVFGTKNTKNEKYFDKAVTWVKEAISSKGVGAKTAVGYGYFDGIESYSNSKVSEIIKLDKKTDTATENLEAKAENLSTPKIDIESRCVEIKIFSKEQRHYSQALKMIEDCFLVSPEEGKILAKCLRDYFKNKGNRKHKPDDMAKILKLDSILRN